MERVAFYFSTNLDAFFQEESANIQDRQGYSLYTGLMTQALPTILVIEKDKPTRELYERALGQQYQVVCASNEQQAMTFLGSGTIKAVILEPAGFGERGWELLVTIKNISSGQHLPVLLCSSWDERQRGLEMGASVYFTKPVLPGALLRALDKLSIR
jgi:DNA-binding response OmpR family regulator